LQEPKKLCFPSKPIQQSAAVVLPLLHSHFSSLLSHVTKRFVLFNVNSLHHHPMATSSQQGIFQTVSVEFHWPTSLAFFKHWPIKWMQSSKNGVACEKIIQ
jgi:hypothetical protein